MSKHFLISACSMTSFHAVSALLAKARTKRKLVETIRKRQSQFLGHALTKGKLDDVTVTGKFEGQKSQRRAEAHIHLKSQPLDDDQRKTND